MPRTDFEDNGPTLELLEKKATGVFAMIDEEIHVPKVRRRDGTVFASLAIGGAPIESVDRERTGAVGELSESIESVRERLES